MVVRTRPVSRSTGGRTKPDVPVGWTGWPSDEIDWPMATPAFTVLCQVVDGYLAPADARAGEGMQPVSAGMDPRAMPEHRRTESKSGYSTEYSDRPSGCARGRRLTRIAGH